MMHKQELAEIIGYTKKNVSYRLFYKIAYDIIWHHTYTRIDDIHMQAVWKAESLHSLGVSRYRQKLTCNNMFIGEYVSVLDDVLLREGKPCAYVIEYRIGEESVVFDAMHDLDARSILLKNKLFRLEELIKRKSVEISIQMM